MSLRQRKQYREDVFNRRNFLCFFLCFFFEGVTKVKEKVINRSKVLGKNIRK